MRIRPRKFENIIYIYAPVNLGLRDVLEDSKRVKAIQMVWQFPQT